MDICVIGDSILDAYFVSDSSRIKLNPERPGVAHVCSGVMYNMGGAAAVARMASRFNTSVKLISSVGKDPNGDMLCYLMPFYSFASFIMKHSGMTTTKYRVLVDDSSITNDRIDLESSGTVDRIAACSAVEEAVSGSRIVLIADYNKGFVNAEIMAVIMRAARSPGRAEPAVVVVDPAYGVDWGFYLQPDIIKANKKEHDAAIGGSGSPGTAYAKAVIVTDGARGMTMYSDGESVSVPAVETNCVDATGAGDSVMASVGVSLARGISGRPMLEFAARNAASSVRRIGA